MENEQPQPIKQTELTAGLKDSGTDIVSSECWHAGTHNECVAEEMESRTRHSSKYCHRFHNAYDQCAFYVK